MGIHNINTRHYQLLNNMGILGLVPFFRFAPELHYKTPFEHPNAARRTLREMRELRYTYEPSHFIVQGIDWREQSVFNDELQTTGCF